MTHESGAVVVLDHVAEVLQALHKLTTNSVLVGIPSEKAGRRDGAINNAALGYIHENGAPEVGIPARPFLLPGVRNVQSTTVDGFKRAAELALEGREGAVERQLHRIGLTAQNAVRAVINAGVPPPLKPGTLAARRRRGRKGTTPLIDTAQLRNSITYVIKGPHGAD